MRKLDKVNFMCHGFQTIEHVKVAEDFFNILADIDKDYIPAKIGMYEPINTPFSIEEAKKMWINSKEEMGFNAIDFKNSKIYGSIEFGFNNSITISLWIKTNVIHAKNGTNKLIALAKKLFLWSNSVYGFACHISNLGGSPGSGLTYQTCLGDICWMTMFGIPYIKMFGKNVLESAPCKVGEFSDNCFMLLTSERPEQITPEVSAIQEKVKCHLGEDAFAREDTTPGVLTVDDLIMGKNIRSTEGYRSPDLSEYILTSKSDNENILVAKVNDDGTIKTYQIKSGDK